MYWATGFGRRGGLFGFPDNGQAEVGYVLSFPDKVEVVRGNEVITDYRAYRLRVGDRIVVPMGIPAEVIHKVACKEYQIPAGSSAEVRPNKVILVRLPPPAKPPRKGKRPPPPASTEAPVLRTLAPTLQGTMTRQTRIAISGNRAGGGPLYAPDPFGAVRQEAAATPALSWTNRLTLKGDQMRLGVVVRRDSPDGEPVFTAEVPISAERCPLPSGILEPGRLLWWRVEVRGPGALPTLSLEARMWLLTDEDTALADQARADARRADPRDRVSWRILGERLRDLGLFGEALDALVKARDAAPGARFSQPAVRMLAQEMQRPAPK